MRWHHGDFIDTTKGTRVNIALEHIIWRWILSDASLEPFMVIPVHGMINLCFCLIHLSETSNGVKLSKQSLFNWKKGKMVSSKVSSINVCGSLLTMGITPWQQQFHISPTMSIKTRFVGPNGSNRWERMQNVLLEFFKEVASVENWNSFAFNWECYAIFVARVVCCIVCV